MLNKADYTGMYKYLFVSGLLYILYNYLLQRLLVSYYSATCQHGTSLGLAGILFIQVILT